MSRPNLGAPVRQRLLNQSRSQGRSDSSTAWRSPVLRRAAADGLAGRLYPGQQWTSIWPAGPITAWRTFIHWSARICKVVTEPDGVDFDPASIQVARIKEDADYTGVRVRFQATLTRARIPMQIDIGFGDVIVPQPVEVEYPTLLDFPAPILIAHPKETVVAEKLEALATLGLLNSRIKDYFDVALLSRLYPFDGRVLVDAIRATFQHRGTPIEPVPIGLTQTYSSDPARAAQWRAFVRRSRLDSAASLDELVAQVRDFSSAPLAAAAPDAKFSARWKPGGPWA